MTSVAVAGATGVVGRHVVAALEDSGVEVVSIARSRGIDLVTGRGVHAALSGVSAVVDVTNVVTTRQGEAVRYFTQIAHHLGQACRQNGVGRYVLLSIVGIDDMPYGYYEGKRQQEQLVLESGVSVSIVRTTQFHEFAGQMLQRFSLGPVGAVPRALCRPVAAAAVARRLADAALADSAPVRSEVAGPECLYLSDMTRRLCRHRRQRMLLLPLRLPGRMGRALAGGTLLPTGTFDMDPLTFDEWLESQP